jgi:hypothetical protein
LTSDSSLLAWQVAVVYITLGVLFVLSFMELYIIYGHRPVKRLYKRVGRRFFPHLWGLG